jgi:hypothetical protein
VTQEDTARRLRELEENWSKHGVRFAASSGARYSGVWSAFSRGSEFYIGARSALGSMKISLHKSGQCRLAIDKTHLPRMVKQGLEAPPPEARALITWRRPTDLASATPLIVRLIFPTDYLGCERPIGKPNKKVLIFEAGSGKAVEFGFLYSNRSAKTLIGKPVFETELANGEYVWMTAMETEFDPRVLPTSEAVNTWPCRILDGAVPDGEANAHKNNMVFFNAPADGQPLQALEIGGVSIHPKRETEHNSG